MMNNNFTPADPGLTLTLTRSRAKYKIQYFAAVCCKTFDPDLYLDELASSVIRSMKTEKCEIDAFSLIGLTSEEEIARIDFVSKDLPPKISSKIDHPVEDLAVALEILALTGPDQLKEMTDALVDKVSQTYHLSKTVISQFCDSCDED